MTVLQFLGERKGYFKGPPRHRRVPWRFLTRFFGVLAALFGLLKVVIELWVQAS